MVWDGASAQGSPVCQLPNKGSAHPPAMLTEQKTLSVSLQMWERSVASRDCASRSARACCAPCLASLPLCLQNQHRVRVRGWPAAAEALQAPTPHSPLQAHLRLLPWEGLHAA